MAAAARMDLNGNPILPMTICMIGAGGFIGSHLCEKLMAETPHTVLAVDVYSDKIKHLLDPPSAAEGQQARHPWDGRIQFHRLNIKHDSRLEGLIKMSDLVPEGAENGLEFTIVRPFNWIGPRMDFIPGIDGPSEGVPRVLACFSNVYSKVSGEAPLEMPTLDVSSKEFYGEGYDDSDKRIPDMTIINKQLGRLHLH
ncbi:hypothetical protein B296_00017047 [Ensete ventricosum]|uniref:NAD-dependent epimerase/dehydratase domain-containing protein n=1 Tax=Ensete ventricosum TaxID=4639 RepID=A0A427APT9_ENSVE|nr:hypothetical protein B296_00017047 [Ensete ventricosum]